MGGGGAKWKDVYATVLAGSARGRARPIVYRLCGDVGGLNLPGVSSIGLKYNFDVTGDWWRAKMAAAGAASSDAHATRLFGGAQGTLHVAVHIRRGDMVYRNFNEQLSPDAYYASAMWHVACGT